ncbi:hypothetical protein O6H91_17G029700 [Diphasiastrum complanatum]|uniref:Uncharacterized protein n=1 Tax=Diphasiastrum complanatum TaxID=34168 RepID=A0ACC2B5G7_DIPCM|nr:hypothetical protein O6H91_17G029700 [Diphasiastrum complanatum]
MHVNPKKVVRANFFRGLRFSIAWWAYTFPMAAASIATIHYSEKVPCLITQGLATALSFLSAAMVFTIFLSTCRTCILADFFPNDVAIAITRKRRKLKPDLIRKYQRYQRIQKRNKTNVAELT